jgi:hypothetical protein
MQNGGNDAKVKGVLLQPSSFWGENIGKICQCGIRVIEYYNGLVRPQARRETYGEDLP